MHNVINKLLILCFLSLVLCDEGTCLAITNFAPTSNPKSITLVTTPVSQSIDSIDKREPKPMFSDVAAEKADGVLPSRQYIALYSTTIPVTALSGVDPSGSAIVAKLVKEPTVSGLTCGSASIAGAGSISCKVTINAAAPNGGMRVSLLSNNPAAVVPGFVTIPANTTSGQFAVTVTAVTTRQSAIVTAKDDNISASYQLTLMAGVPTLSVNPSLTFGDVLVGSSATERLTLTSTGTLPVTVLAPKASSTAFTVSSGSFPVTLKPGQTETLVLHFNPVQAGATTAQLTTVSNSSTGSTAVTKLSGIGMPAVSAIACSPKLIAGLGTIGCDVTLRTAAPSGGVIVSLTSGNGAVTLPATITLPGGATKGQFTGTVTQVETSQRVTLTASASGTSTSTSVQLIAADPVLGISNTSLIFGMVAVDETETKTVTLASTGNVPVTVQSAALTGTSFKILGMNFPFTLNPGQTATLSVQFRPTQAGVTTGQLTIVSNSSTNGTAVTSLNGEGRAALAGLACTPASITGAGTLTCQITLNAPAPASGLSLSLSSSNPAVVVRASASVSGNATSGYFVADVTPVLTTQTATLTASAYNVSRSFQLTLNAGTPVLNVNVPSLAFGDVTLNTSATLPLILASTGNAPVTISTAILNSSNYSVSGLKLPVTLNPGQTATLNVQFDPTTSGSSAGQLTLIGNSSTNAHTVIGLSGTGLAATGIANIDVGNTPGLSIPSNFLGLAHEWGMAQTFMGDSTVGVDLIYRQLLQNLTAYGAGPMLVRIGGNSTDTSGQPTSTTVQPFAELADALGTRFSLGVNLGSDDVNLAVDQATAYVNQMPAGSLESIEIGNEPEAYSYNGYRPSSYTFQNYLSDFNTWKTNITPLLPTGTALTGPSWGATNQLSNIAPFLSVEASSLAVVSQHYYVGLAGPENAPDMLLTPSAATTGPNAVAAAVATTHQYSLPFRMGEINSIGPRGQPGITDAFESALWAVDMMFGFANVGVDGVNWHIGTDAPSDAFSLYQLSQGEKTTYVLTAVHPLYYGLLFFEEATGKGSRVLPAIVNTQANLTAWATVDATSTPRLVILNKDEYSTGNVNVTISGYTHAKVYRLTAPTYQSTSGVTFAGQTFDGSTDGTIHGTQTAETFDAVDGMFEIPMPITSGALVVFTR